MATQFQNNRFPVVTWRHPKNQAVLLRSSSFVPCSIAKKSMATSALGYVQAQAQAKFAHTKLSKAAEYAPGNEGGIGIYNVNVENYLLSVLLVSQMVRREQFNVASSLVQQLSIPPAAINFDPELPRTDSVDSFGAVSSPVPSSKRQLFNRPGSASSKDSGIAVEGAKAGKLLKNSPIPRRKLLVSKSPEATRKFSLGSFELRKYRGKGKGSNPSTSAGSSPKGSPDSNRKLPEKARSMSQLTAAEKSDSPSQSPQFPPKKLSGSDESCQQLEKKLVAGSTSNNDIQLGDIVVMEKRETSRSPERPMSPIDWEAVGNDRTESPISEENEKGGGKGTSGYSGSADESSSPELNEKRPNGLEIQWEHFEDRGKRKAIHQRVCVCVCVCVCERERDCEYACA